MQDVAQDVAQDVTGATEDGSVGVSILPIVIFQRWNPHPTHACVLVLHVSPKGKRLGRHACAGRKFHRWKMTMEKISTFTLPPSAAPSTFSSFTCRPRAAWGAVKGTAQDVAEDVGRRRGRGREGVFIRGAGLCLRGPGGARPPRHATIAAAAVFAQLALGLGRNWAAQWHSARAVGKRFRGCRAKRLNVDYVSILISIIGGTHAYRYRRVKRPLNV